MMDFRRLFELLAVFVALLATEVFVSAQRNYARTDDFSDGSGENVDEEWGSGDEDDDGSAGEPVYDRRPVKTSKYPVNGIPTRAPDNGIIMDSSSLNRGTTSVYSNGVQIATIDETESEEVRSEALTKLLTHPAVLAAIIVGGVLTILFVILLVMFIVYRMRKKDEGSYILDDPKTLIGGSDLYQYQPSSVVYIKAPTNDREFYA